MRTFLKWALLGALACVVLFFGAAVLVAKSRDEPLEINAGVCAADHPTPPTGGKFAPRKFRASNADEARAIVGLLRSAVRRSTSLEVDGEWVMHGQIDKDAAEALKQRLTQAPAPRLLRITSAGGGEYSAIAMADLIAAHRLPVVVDTVCGSSCANYLLPAARRVQLEGMVLMHGSPVACSERLGFWNGVRQFGPDGYLHLRAAANRQRQFEQRFPRFWELVANSASPDRGDPTGAPHVWRHVPPAELAAAHPDLTVGAGHARAVSGYRAFQRVTSGSWSDIYFP